MCPNHFTFSHLDPSSPLNTDRYHSLLKNKTGNADVESFTFKPQARDDEESHLLQWLALLQVVTSNKKVLSSIWVFIRLLFSSVCPECSSDWSTTLPVWLWRHRIYIITLQKWLKVSFNELNYFLWMKLINIKHKNVLFYFELF